MRGYAEQVVIGCGAKIIARHQRSYEGEDNVFDPLHYLPLIERNIGALDQAAALAGAAPPLRLRTGTVFRVTRPASMRRVSSRPDTAAGPAPIPGSLHDTRVTARRHDAGAPA